MKDNILKKKIMHRVYFLFWVHKLTSSIALKSYALVAFFAISIFQVSLVNVFANMPNLLNFSALYTFLSVAFSSTELVVQFSLVGIFFVSVWLGRDIIKTTFVQPSILPMYK